MPTVRTHGSSPSFRRTSSSPASHGIRARGAAFLQRAGRSRREDHPLASLAEEQEPWPSPKRRIGPDSTDSDSSFQPDPGEALIEEARQRARARRTRYRRAGIFVSIAAVAAIAATVAVMGSGSSPVDQPSPRFPGSCRCSGRRPAGRGCHARRVLGSDPRGVGPGLRRRTGHLVPRLRCVDGRRRKPVQEHRRARTHAGGPRARAVGSPRRGPVQPGARAGRRLGGGRVATVRARRIRRLPLGAGRHQRPVGGRVRRPRRASSVPAARTLLRDRQRPFTGFSFASAGDSPGLQGPVECFALTTDGADRLVEVSYRPDLRRYRAEGVGLRFVGERRVVDMVGITPVMPHGEFVLWGG